MNTKTTKRAVTESTTKAAPATGSKRSRRSEANANAGNESATQAGPAGRKRTKPFVL